ncbi:hypothetical protein [Rhizobium sp. FKY42]|uniref:hypothetical protein n=1 Tax=Rhizobium sp. FKY42 TaxID=2562310 RepID=UPI0010C0E238|nr:hypothetical protein [Rhizobium sp. FKY42]
MALLVGHVIRVWDRKTKPPKFKRHICICPQANMFFRINSKPLFPPHMILRAEGAPFLEHDSYIELQQLIKDMAFEVNQAEVLGRLTPTHVQALKISITQCGALTDEVKDFIMNRLDQY